MKKTLFLFVSFILTCVVAILLIDTWETTAAIQRESTVGTLKIERQYNASRWAEPLPLKKIHAYTATLAPKHAVIVETDQDFVNGRQYFIRFLTRDKAPAISERALRPISGSLRIRLATDGTPETVESTAAIDRALGKAMGDAPKTSAAAAPTAGREADSVPFLVGGANDSTLELIWQNSTVGEWMFLIVLLFLTKASLLSAWFTPWSDRAEKAEQKKFVHPSLRKIDADTTTHTPPPPIPLVRKSIPLPTRQESSDDADTATHPPLKLPPRK